MSDQKTVRTRFAPSPTGYSHLGFISRILINYALAKQNGGQFIWRNEDTDQERFVPGALAYNMQWTREFGLDWDEGPDDDDLPEELRKGGPYAPYTQTKRLERYAQAAEKLIVNGYAYRCFCSKERLDEMRAEQEKRGQLTRYDGHCRHLSEDEVQAKMDAGESFVIRIKIPENRKIEFDDLITHNHVVWDSADVDDAVLMKSNGIPTYHLAAMYDDVEMKITHALRGSEWLASTPIHQIIFEGLGIEPENKPQIGHFTVILDPSTPGKKFSKRNNNFKASGLIIKGYLPEAILNYLMLLGWAPKDNQEIFSLNEFVEKFDMTGMQKANPTWDHKKMDWFNGVYLRKFDAEAYVGRFYNWIEKYLLQATEEEERGILVNEQEGLTLELVHDYLQFSREILEKRPENLPTVIALVQERATNFWQALQQIHFFYERPHNINWEIKQLKNVTPDLRKDLLQEFRELITGFEDNTGEWWHETWEQAMREIGDKYEVKHGDVFMLLRVAVCGSPFSPPLFESLQVLGKGEVLERL